MVSIEVKKKLQQKSKDLGISLTQYIEKLGLEPIIFADENVKLLLKTLNLK